MGSPFPRQSNSYLFVVVRKIKENADKRTKKIRCLQASGIKSDQLLFHTSSSRTGGISHLCWANRHHMLTWLGNRLTQGNVTPLEHLNNTYRTKSTLIIYSCRAWLPRWVSSSFASTSVMLMNIKGQGISSAGAFASCPPVWGIWQGFKSTEQLQPPQAAQKIS